MKIVKFFLMFNCHARLSENEIAFYRDEELLKTNSIESLILNAEKNVEIRKQIMKANSLTYKCDSCTYYFDKKNVPNELVLNLSKGNIKTRICQLFCKKILTGKSNFYIHKYIYIY